jgi:hypothetical protein
MASNNLARNTRERLAAKKRTFSIALMGVEHSMRTTAASQMRIAAGKVVDRLPGGF